MLILDDTGQRAGASSQNYCCWTYNHATHNGNTVIASSEGSGFRIEVGIRNAG
ncbi:hypothetical protein [Scytonema sp. NUACC26]|uniref:hypothetical protein n=1 Tax=Scytonema sp. NUACC26 TaxID=3140176 RepID=UPI0038B3DBD3